MPSVEQNTVFQAYREKGYNSKDINGNYRYMLYDNVEGIAINALEALGTLRPTQSSK